jgi:hypothetical protein
MPGASYSFILVKTFVYRMNIREHSQKNKKLFLVSFFVIIIGFVAAGFFHSVCAEELLFAGFFIIGNNNIFTYRSGFCLVFPFFRLVKRLNFPAL